MGLIEDVLNEIEDKPIDDIQIGITFVGVRIGTRIGVAHRVDSYSGTNLPTTFRNRIGTKVADLIYSENLIHAAIGTAAINAQLMPDNIKCGNIFKTILDMANKFDTIGVIGKFPFIAQLKELDCTVYAFEKKPIPGFLPANKTEELLPQCELAIITGTTFVNSTLERLLNLSKGYTIVIGPTSPLSSVLFKYGADVIAGIIAYDNNVIEVIKHGGGTREFKKLVDVVYIETGR